MLFAVLMVSVQLYSNYSTQDQSENFSIRDYGHAVLDPLPPKAILLLKGGNYQRPSSATTIIIQWRRGDSNKILIHLFFHHRFGQ